MDGRGGVVRRCIWGGKGSEAHHTPSAFSSHPARQNQDAFQSKIDNLTQNVAGVPQQQQLGGQFAAQRQQQQLNQQRGGQFQNGQRQNGGQINNNMGGFGGQMGMGGMDMSAMNMGGMNMGVQEMMVSFRSRASLGPFAYRSLTPISIWPLAARSDGTDAVYAAADGADGAGPAATAAGAVLWRTSAHERSLEPTQPPSTSTSPGRRTSDDQGTCCSRQADRHDTVQVLARMHQRPVPVLAPKSGRHPRVGACARHQPVRAPEKVQGRRLHKESCLARFGSRYARSFLFALCVSACRSADSLSAFVFIPPGHAGPSQLPCKYQNCNNPSCPFLHTDAEGNAIPPPALTDPSLAVPHPKKEPKFASAPKPKPYHAPVSKGGFSPYTKGKSTPIAASGGMNKSVKFNPEAAAFVPVSPHFPFS